MRSLLAGRQLHEHLLVVEGLAVLRLHGLGGGGVEGDERVVAAVRAQLRDLAAALEDGAHLVAGRVRAEQRRGEDGLRALVSVSLGRRLGGRDGDGLALDGLVVERVDGLLDRRGGLEEDERELVAAQTHLRDGAGVGEERLDGVDVGVAEALHVHAVARRDGLRRGRLGGGLGRGGLLGGRLGGGLSRGSLLGGGLGGRGGGLLRGGLRGGLGRHGSRRVVWGHPIKYRNCY